jgi:hypothetical protein
MRRYLCSINVPYGFHNMEERDESKIFHSFKPEEDYIDNLSYLGGGSRRITV